MLSKFNKFGKRDPPVSFNGKSILKRVDKEFASKLDKTSRDFTNERGYKVSIIDLTRVLSKYFDEIFDKVKDEI